MTTRKKICISTRLYCVEETRWFYFILAVTSRSPIYEWHDNLLIKKLYQCRLRALDKAELCAVQPGRVHLLAQWQPHADLVSTPTVHLLSCGLPGRVTLSSGVIYARPKFSVRAAATFGSSDRRSEMCSQRSEITDIFIQMYSLPATTKRKWLVKSIRGKHAPPPIKLLPITSNVKNSSTPYNIKTRLTLKPG